MQAGLLEEPPFGFDGAEILFGSKFPALFLHQPLLTPYPSYGLDADGEIIVALDSFRPEARERLFQLVEAPLVGTTFIRLCRLIGLPRLDGLLMLCLENAFCRMARRSALIRKPSHRPRLRPSHPFADGLRGRFERPCSGFDAMLFRKGKIEYFSLNGLTRSGIQEMNFYMLCKNSSYLDLCFVGSSYCIG